MKKHHGSPVVHLIPFQQGQIQAIEQEGRQWVAVKPVCEDLGLDWKSQHIKLSSLEWATMVIITTVGADGKQREMACVDVDTLLMWLATIHVSKVKAASRPALVAYQKHVKKVIADYFLGRSAKGPDMDKLASEVAALRKILADQARQIAQGQWSERSQQMLVTKVIARRRRAELADLVDLIHGTDRTKYEWRHGYAAELRACFKAATGGESTRFTDMTWEQAGKAEQWIRQRVRMEVRRLRRTKQGRAQVAQAQRQRRVSQTELFN